MKKDEEREAGYIEWGNEWKGGMGEKKKERVREGGEKEKGMMFKETAITKE